MDLPFEILRYRPLRRMLFSGLSGTLLEAGVGTGRNMPFYPPEARVTAIDASPEMLARAADRAARLGRTVTLLQRNVRDTGLPDRSFDAVAASFLFWVLGEEDQLPALQKLARLCKPDGEVRLCEPWVISAYGASFDRNIEPLMPAAGLADVQSRFVVDELIRYVFARPEKRLL